jgi:protein phosphatase
VTVLRSGSASHVGRVRALNEDRAVESLTLYAVADGMGGHAGGEVAARTAVDALADSFSRQPTARGLVEAMRQANTAVFQQSLVEEDLRGMGTTLVAVALVHTDDGDRLVLANVGDSRAYRYRDGSIEQLTMDHSVAEQLVARGEITAAEAAVHPHRHILTRALGIGPEVEVDVWQIVPVEGDRYLLCSDGLSNEVSSERIGGVLESTRDPQDAAEVLVRLANEHGGSDNITVVVVDVIVGDLPPDAPLAPDVFIGEPSGNHGATSLSGSERQEGSTDGVPDPTGPLSGVTQLDPSDMSALSADDSGLEASSSGLPPRTPAVRIIRSSRRDTAATDDEVPQGASPAVSGTGALAPAGSASRQGSTMAARSFPSPSAPHSSRGEPYPVPERVTFRPPRRITFRVLLFLVVVLALLAGAWGLTRWYVDSSYYVGLRHDRVVIFEGRPGGFLWFKPRLVERTSLGTSSVLPYRVPSLQAGVQEPSLAAARQFVSDIRAEALSTGTGTGSPATGTGTGSPPQGVAAAPPNLTGGRL